MGWGGENIKEREEVGYARNLKIQKDKRKP